MEGDDPLLDAPDADDLSREGSDIVRPLDGSGSPT